MSKPFWNHQAWLVWHGMTGNPFQANFRFGFKTTDWLWAHGHPWPSMAHLCHDKFVAPLRSNLDWFANWPWLHVGWKLMEFWWIWWILSSNFFQLCALRVTACRACFPNKGDCLPAMPWHSFLLQLDSRNKVVWDLIGSSPLTINGLQFARAVCRQLNSAPLLWDTPQHQGRSVTREWRECFTRIPLPRGSIQPRSHGPDDKEHLCQKSCQTTIELPVQVTLALITKSSGSCCMWSCKA